MTDQTQHTSEPRARLIVLADFDALDDKLSEMNEAGIMPTLPFIDAHGTANIAHGTAPCGDDWVVDYEAPRDPDSGSRHCCTCVEHDPLDCDSGAVWKPTFPIVAMVAKAQR